VLYVQTDKTLRNWEPYGTDFEAVISDLNGLSKIQLKDVQNGLSKLIKRYKLKRA
jgi:hypothetical protein